MRRNERPENSNVLRVSPKLANSLTDYRKATIQEGIENGIVAEGRNYEGSMLKNAIAPPPPTTDVNKINRGSWHDGAGVVGTGTAPYRKGVVEYSPFGVIAHSESYKIKKAEEDRMNELYKKAGVSTVSGGTSTTSGSNVERLAPEIYSPLFTMSNLNLPRDRITVNAWIRNFFLLHPIVRNVITLHATYPISKINIRCHDMKIQQFFEDMIEEMDLMNSLGDIALEWWKMGECFPYAELNEKLGKWSRIVIQNPDYISVKKSVLSGDPIISMRPDEVLRRLVFSNNPADVQLRKQIPDNIIYHVRTGNDIPLDNFNVSHLKMLSSPYDVRGTSIIVSAFKDLMLYDKLRECKYAQADDLVNPITVVKLGGTADGDYRATPEDLENMRQILEEATYDKSFKLITHAGVDISRVGASGQVLEISEDMNLVIKMIYTALMIPPAVIDTESAVYASASIGLEVLRQRYFNFRNIMARWLVNKIFAPISEIQEFYEYKNGVKRLIVPDIEWNQMNLYDMQDHIQNLTGLVGSKQASLQTLYKSLGLNYEEERVKMRQEIIDGAIRQREEMALQTMSLSELRALDPEKEIVETPSSGEEQLQMPPEAGGLAGAGGGMGGMPPMGGGGGLGGGLGALEPPPMPTAPGAGAPEISGGVPPLGPGTATGGPGMGGPTPVPGGK